MTPTPQANTLDELKDILIDVVNKIFPKGECKERGNAMVMVAELVDRLTQLKETSNENN